MIRIITEILGAWLAAATISALALGALIQSAEKVHREEILAALFSYLAEHQAHSK